MKSFQIPILSTRGLAMSLLGLCLLSGLDAPPTHADFTFGEPVNLKTTIPAIDGNEEIICCFSSDGLEMYITSWRPNGSGGGDLYVLKRSSKDEAWGPLQNLGPGVNSSEEDRFPSISDDGLTLYFDSNRNGLFDVWVTERTTRDDPWGPPVILGPKVNSGDQDGKPWISANSLELYFGSYRPGGYGYWDIYVATRTTASDPWGEAENLGPVVNSPHSEHPCLSPDGLLLIYHDSYSDNAPVPRPGGYGSGDIWMARRASLSAPWQAPQNLGPMINSPIIDCEPQFSFDGSMLYFATGVGFGTWEYWQSPIIPTVDFNGDGIVDAADVCIMVEHWFTDYPLCDIGPFPWGDGIVDVQDLIVFAEHLEVADPNAVVDPNLATP